MHSATETETHLDFLCCLMTAGQCFDAREGISEKSITCYLFTGQRRFKAQDFTRCGFRPGLWRRLPSAERAVLGLQTGF